MPEVVGRASAPTSEDPFGPGDPLEVARLVRRALADAGRRAVEVSALVVVAEAEVPPDALDRFVRRALGPHGAAVASSVLVVAPDLGHAERLALAIFEPATARHGSVVMAVALGPNDAATAACFRCPASLAITR
jgi:hypothetical protein